MELSGLGIELIHYLSRQFDLPVRDYFWRSIPNLNGLSNMKYTSFQSGRNQCEDMQTKTEGLDPQPSAWIVLIDQYCV